MIIDCEELKYTEDLSDSRRLENYRIGLEKMRSADLFRGILT